MNTNRRILIIDDDEGIRKLYQKIFTPVQRPEVMQKTMYFLDAPEEGSASATKNSAESSAAIEYQLSLAENGLKGIEFVKNAVASDLPFAVAFIDMRMPGLNGAETSKQIWEIDPEIKIVIVTAFSEYSLPDLIKFIGRDDIFYLKKPFNHNEILQFARALTHEWDLEKNRDFLELCLNKANATLEEKIKTQAALIVQAEKMASIGVLAAGIAHEINNPIAFINSNLSVLKNYFKDITDLFKRHSNLETALEKEDNENIAEHLKDIKVFKEEKDINIIIEDINNLADESIDGIQRVKNIVHDLKDFSRIDEAEYKHLDINDSIDTTLNIIWNQLKYKVTIEKDYGNFPEIKCFPQKISQVFMNLLINAGQAIEKKGIIKISTRAITKGKRKADKFIEITISDTGIGIPENNLNKLFDPFFTTKPVGEGTGLGLSITYEIIKAHNGEIRIESEPGKGTQITLLLPAIT